MTEWEWYTDSNTKLVFFHLLLTVNFEDKPWRGMTIKRGQRVTSLPILADEINLSIQQVRTSLNKLKSTGEITDESSSKGRVITVTSYSEHQGDDRQSNRQSTDNQQTSQQAGNRLVTATKEGKKERREEKKEGGEFPLPSNWATFLKFRKEIRAKVTETQEPKLLKEAHTLAKESNTTPEAILEQSMTKGWRGLFAIKGQQGKANGTHDNLGQQDFLAGTERFANDAGGF